METWDSLKEKKDKFKKETNEKYSEESKERLKKIISKRIRTTMIASLDTFEKKFGYLWGHGDRPKTEEEKLFRNIYEEVRKQILDIGNDQIRNAEKEIDQYNIKWKRYKVTMPVVKNYEEYQKLRKEHYEREDI